MITLAPGHSGNPDTCPACVSFRSGPIAPDPGVSVREFIDARNLVAQKFAPKFSAQFAPIPSSTDAATDAVAALIALGWRKVAEPES